MKPEVEYVVRTALCFVAAVAGVLAALIVDNILIKIVAWIVVASGFLLAAFMLGRLFLVKVVIGFFEWISADIERKVVEDEARRQATPYKAADPNAKHRSPGPPIGPAQ